jgi:quinolinate synthase
MTTEEMIDRINLLKKEKNAIVLAHNYQRGEIQDIADFTGDSLELSIKAADVEESVIVFCGVKFMAETAKILAPEKTVLIPNINAGCPMADMVTAENVRELKAKHPKAKVLCYVNSSAEVKAECDLCCTSGNAVKLVEHEFEKDDEIIFVPDQWLARYTAEQLGREFITWDGYCPTHARILPEDITTLKEKYPAAEVIVHPECPKDICDLADAILSTGKMSGYARDSKADTFIIGTENEMLHRLRKENPTKTFIESTKRAVCPNMKKINMKNLLNALENFEDEIILDEEIMKKADRSIRRMIEVSKEIM